MWGWYTSGSAHRRAKDSEVQTRARLQQNASFPFPSGNPIAIFIGIALESKRFIVLALSSSIVKW
jgi:hypothetical protein